MSDYLLSVLNDYYVFVVFFNVSSDLQAFSSICNHFQAFSSIFIIFIEFPGFNKHFIGHISSGLSLTGYS